MRSFGKWFATTSSLTLCLGLIGCEEKPKPEAQATAAATPTPTPAPEPEPEPVEPPKEPARPLKIDTELTDERRAAVEKAFADAKGFLAATEIEEKLKKNDKVSAKEAAIQAFDRTAKGKWVLFTGPMVNLTEKSFDLGVTYTPRAENDPMGMSRQWFPVTISDVEGYSQDKFKPGNTVVVLAKYTGGGKASPGHELVELGHWSQ